MSGREYAIWLVRLVLLVATYLLISQTAAGSTYANPLAAASLNSLVLIMILFVISYVLIVVFSLNDAEKVRDQSKQPCVLFSMNFSGYFLAYAVVTGLGYYLYSGDGVALFTICFIGLVMSQACEYVPIIFTVRRGGGQSVVVDSETTR